jgi:translation initiation factor 5B
MKSKIRQPIVTVCGHVDHGKTSILDSLRGSSVTETEAGSITQRISFTSYPLSKLKSSCPLIEKSGIKLEIPGFLFIDTPGHAAFTNLRKRGGSLADLAVLVIDINEGIKPQTSEVIQILKLNKTPFVIALNKIDKITGWQYNDKDMKQSIESQGLNARRIYEEKLYTIIGALNSYGFEADIFYNINDFTKNIALVPCSAKTFQGLEELMMILCGLSQKYLTERLMLGKEAKGVILEIKKQKAINYIESILYDGTLSRNDEIAIPSLLGDLSIAKIRILEEIEPLSVRFKPKEKIQAATGFRMQLAEKTDITPGMPFVLYKGNKEQLKKQFKKEISENISAFLSNKGIIAKADSLGSLEALLAMLKQENIPVVKTGIGNVNKNDIASAKANLKINELDAVIIGFNVSIDEETKELVSKTGKKESIKILTDEIIYKLLENLVEFRFKKRIEMEKARLMSLSSLCKLKILSQYVFRNSNPAIFGVRVETGKLNSGTELINSGGEKVSRVKAIQSENKSVEEAGEGMEAAISLPGVNFERQLKDKEYLYSNISESSFKNFRKNKDLLNSRELLLLSEIAKMRKIEI